jgi:hypothetical protein
LDTAAAAPAYDDVVVSALDALLKLQFCLIANFLGSSDDKARVTYHVTAAFSGFSIKCLSGILSGKVIFLQFWEFKK